MARQNPFKPQFGVAPDYFIGRRQILSSLVDAAKDSNSPWRVTLITAPRGVGKTALMADARKLIKNAKFVSVPMSGEFKQAVLESLNEVSQSQEYNVDAKVFSYKATYTEPQSFLAGLRNRLNKNQLTVFSIDEVQGDLDQLAEFVMSYQQLLQDGFNLMLMMAGLPAPIEKLMQQPTTTFLRRAKRVRLGGLLHDEIVASVLQAFTDTGKKISVELAEQLATTSGGYTYLVQLLGYYTWAYTEKMTTQQHLDTAIAESEHMMIDSAITFILRDMSAREVDLLMAMAKYEVACNQDLIKDMQVTKQWVYKYTQRLLGYGVIKQIDKGQTIISIPFLREYLQDDGSNKIPEEYH
ncbi:MAG: ATP-binding protein [Lactobacillaceae bacterium]|jgi:hypothetical protein|nr:ATP-binding protein [Lactobacillaceae bacterium]